MSRSPIHFDLAAPVFLMIDEQKSCKDPGGPVCPGLGLFGMLEQPGLGESFGKASSGNTAFRSSRFDPMANRNPSIVQAWLRHSSEAWPYEALKRGLPRPFEKRGRNWGERQLNKNLDRILQSNIIRNTVSYCGTIKCLQIII